MQLKFQAKQITRKHSSLVTVAIVEWWSSFGGPKFDKIRMLSTWLAMEFILKSRGIVYFYKPRGSSRLFVDRLPDTDSQFVY